MVVSVISPFYSKSKAQSTKQILNQRLEPKVHPPRVENRLWRKIIKSKIKNTGEILQPYLVTLNSFQGLLMIKCLFLVGDAEINSA